MCRCVSILKRQLFGNSPPLLFVAQSLETMGAAMIPCMMLVLGGSLAEGPEAAVLPARVIIGTVVVRLLLIPTLGKLASISLEAGASLCKSCGLPELALQHLLHLH